MSPSPERTRTNPAVNHRAAALSARRFVALALAFLLLAQTIAPPSLAVTRRHFSRAALGGGTPPSPAALNGKRGAGARATSAPTATAAPGVEQFGVVLTPLGTAFAGHVGIEHHEPLRRVVISSNNPTGSPFNFEALDADGTHRPHSNVSGLAGALRIAVARDDGAGLSRGGFKPGELFSGTGVPGVIARVSPEGASVQNPWVTLEGEGGLLSGLFIDRAGVFGGDLVVVTTAGGVWRVNSAGVAARVAGLGTHLAGVTTIPDDAARYGPWAGRILAGAKDEGAVYAIDARGNSAAFQLGLNPEDIRVVPAHENFYGVDPAGGKIWGAPDDAFAGIIGDILVAQGTPGVLARVRWNGTEFEVGQLAQVGGWGQITFSPAALSEIGGVKQIYDKIAVTRHAPQLDSGRVEGALWQMLPENVVLDGTDVITSDLLVPGTPTVTVGSGKPSFGGVIDGVESPRPAGHSVTVSNNASLRHVITRTNPIDLMPVPAPPAPAGTRDVSLSRADERYGDLATLRNLSISGKAGAVTVPPGAYGKFTATGHTQFVFGVEGATTPSVYNLEELSLSGGSKLRLVGPVKLNVRGNVSLSGSTVGAAADPQHLLLSVSQGSLGVTGNGVLYGVVRIPQGTVVIGGNGRIRGTVTCDRLNIFGNGVLQITESDVAPPPVNRPPTADAGPDQTLTLPTDPASLNGTATDDGLPSPGTLLTTWTKISGPGPVTFSAPDNTVTTATFIEPGVYVLRLSAGDSLLTASDEVTVEVFPRNQPPMVNAGADQEIELPNGATLNGTVSDDALPRGSNITKTWSVVSGPGTVTFADPHDSSTAATFAAPGDYVLRLTADDTEFSVSDDVLITALPENRPPAVDAGPDQSFALPAAASLVGSVTDDGLPSGGVLSVAWSKVSGPGVVTFGDAARPATTATFSEAGDYVLRLEASDSQKAASDEVSVSVMPYLNGPPDITSEPPTELSLGPAPAGEGELVNLGPWTARQYELNSQPSANWVKDLANSIATQTVNADASFLLSDFSLSNEQMEGTWRVNTTNDDDFIGFVFGYQNAEHFYLFDWKQGSQNDSLGFAERGMSLKVFNADSPLTGRDFWPTAGNGARVRTLYHNTIPWSEFTDYRFTLQFHPGRIRIVVRQGEATLADFTVNDTTYANGRFGFYNYSQASVRYTGFRRLSLVRGVYVYDVEATDPDDDTLNYSLDAAPAGMTIDPATGLINWPVTLNEVGQRAVAVRVRDPHGNSDTQSYTLTVADPNQKPAFKVYTLDADFDEGSSVNVTRDAPDQLQLGGAGEPAKGTWSAVFDSGRERAEWGRVGWTARVCGGGLLTVSVATGEDGATFGQPVTVSNGDDPEVPAGRYARVTVEFERAPGGESPVLYDLILATAGFEVATPINLAPEVGAGPDQTLAGVTGTTLRGVACDDGLPSNRRLAVSWSKVSGPGAVTFARADSSSTEVTFGATGIYELRLTATDSVFGSSDTVVVEVLPPNEAPAVSAGPNLSVTHPDAATLQGTVTDDGLPRGGTLAVAWSKISGPGGVAFAQPNAPATTARFGAAGTYVLRLTAGDAELTAHDEVTVMVGGENRPPAVSAGPDRTITLPRAAALEGTADDDGWPEGTTLAVAWEKVSGPGVVTFGSAGQAATTATFAEPGDYVLRLSAGDSLLSASDEVRVNVNPAVPPPVASIKSLPDGAEVTTRVNVTGTVSAGSNWRLEYAPGGGTGSAWTTLAAGSTPVTDGPLGVFDPTLLLNGTYTLRLVATDAAEQTTATSLSLVVTGEQKVGNFSISFSDLVIPVAGLPIEVMRTYDSRDKRSGDFGVGWTLGIKNVRVEKSGVLGAGWEQTRSGGFLPTYCLVPTRPRSVTITFPGGKVYQFRTVTSPQCSVLVPIQTAVVGFAPAAGTRGSLTAFGDNDVLVIGNPPGPAELVSFDKPDAYNPTRFRLTSEDGTVFVIDEALGVLSVAEPDGNALSIDANGITHSSGKSVTFARDAQGRITRITDPTGNALTYAYDAAGDLVTFRDREGHSNTFSYNASHGLLTITDPRGIRPLTNDYDAQGRLVRQTDALGKALDIAHDLDARREVVTDRLGRVTVYEYDARGNVVRVTDAEGGVSASVFDARDNLLSETDPLGKTTTYTYDAQDNRTSVTDPLGNTERYTHNARGQVLTVTDALGRVTTNTYDANGNLVAVRDPLGATTTNTYDQRGLLTSTTDALGSTVTLGYDAAGNLTRRTDQLGNVTVISYDANGNLLSDAVTRTTPAGPETLTTTYRYDRAGRPTLATLPDGSTAEAVVNSLGRVSTRIDQLGRRTGYEYDEMGRLVKITYPDGTAETSVLDAEGQLVKAVDRAGRAITYEYDAAGMLLKTTLPDGSSASSAYNALGLVTASTDAAGHRTTYEYDAAGRRTKLTNALNQTYTFAYDDAGNLASATDPQGRVTRFEYDAGARRTKIVFPDDTTQTTAYDAAGRATAQTDQAGRPTLCEYDALGRLTKVTDALGGLTRYTYDELGNLLTQTDANDHTTTFAYDNMGRLVRRTLPLGMSATYTYAADGSLTSYTDFRGKRTGYEYDEVGRLTKKMPDASLNEPAVSFTYSPAGQRATMTDATGTTSYAYDAAGRLKSKSTPHGALAYTYDTAGNLLTARSSNPNGVSADYSYDELHRLSAVRDNQLAATAASYTYGTNGALASTLYANGARTGYTYDALDRLTNVSAEAGGAALASYAYTLGAAGNRLSVTEAGGRTVSYTYDALYRLTEERIGGGDAARGVIAYAYDAVGNRLSRSSSVPGVAPAASSYDANDRLQSDAYDQNGNTVGSQGAAYSFDYENRLTSINGGAVRYVYDGDGNRVARTVGGVTTRYLVDTNNPTGHAQVVEELEGGQVTRQYTYGHSLISQRRLDGGQWRTSFYGYDGQRSVRYLTDEQGAVTDTYTYDAFGNLIARAGNTPNEYLFAGERFDAEAGLYYLRARFLQPNSGRFWSMDSYAGDSFDPPSLHKYTYTRNDPVDFIDPSGNKEITLAGTLKTLAIVNLMTVALTHGLTYIAHGRLANNEEMWKALRASNTITLLMLLGPAYLAPRMGVSSAGFIYASSAGLTTFFTALGLKDMAYAKTDRQRVAAALGLLISVVLGYYGLRAGGKTPAHAYADEVRATHGDGTSSSRSATVALVETPGGKDFRGAARGKQGIPEDLHPQMAKALDSVPGGSRELCHGTCAEIVAINKMLHKDINPRGSVVTTAKVRNPSKMIKGTNKPEHGATHPPCSTCASVLEYFNVSYSFF